MVAGNPPAKGGAFRSSGDAAAPVTGGTSRPGDLGDITLPAGPGLPSAARAAVLRWLDGRVPADVVVDAQLLVSELAANSCLHAGQRDGTPVRVRAGTEADSVWFEVGDAGREGAVTRRTPAPEAGGGFGLQLVEALAAGWGVTHVDGTQVWFSLYAQLPGRA